MISTSNMIGKKVLLIDDDRDLLELSRQIFTSAGAQVVTACDGSEGIRKFLTDRPDLILLDIMMPGINGFEVCRKIRQISNIPLIILTALHGEQNMVQALDLGADDFLLKPFTGQVAVARAKAVLRRSRWQNENSPRYRYNDGHLIIDSERHQILISGKKVKASPTEFRLLSYLEKNAGKTLAYDRILANVWGEEYRGNTDIVHVYVSTLRSKIEENPKRPRYVQSVHGVGYIFERQDNTDGE
jgi:DNA-binding response OmpR family regulator